MQRLPVMTEKILSEVLDRKLCVLTISQDRADPPTPSISCSSVPVCHPEPQPLGATGVPPPRLVENSSGANTAFANRLALCQSISIYWHRQERAGKRGNPQITQISQRKNMQAKNKSRSLVAAVRLARDDTNGVSWWGGDEMFNPRGSRRGRGIGRGR